MIDRKPLLLASASPRRRELLARLGVTFQAQGFDVDETIAAGTAAEQAVCELALRKLASVPDQARWRWILCADTIVCLKEGRILGKPANAAEATSFLGMLEGREHRVITGVCLALPERDERSVRFEQTVVCFSPMSQQEIAWYVDSGEWKDAAGGYKIQDRASAFIEEIKGSPSNVIGLPMRLVYSMLLTHRYPFR